VEKAYSSPHFREQEPYICNPFHSAVWQTAYYVMRPAKAVSQRVRVQSLDP
jgi:hypothetical protein